MNWKRIHVGLYVDLDKICFVEIKESTNKVYANFGNKEILLQEFSNLSDAKEFIKKITDFTDID